jgi:hypothetical protein
MTRRAARGTLWTVNDAPACARRFVVALVVFLAAVLTPLGARAASASFDVGDQAFGEIRGVKGDIVVKTWDRPQVQVDSDDNFVGRKAPVRYGSIDLPFDIPMRAQTIPTKNGPVQLPTESFIVSSVRAGQHDGVYVDGTAGAATVMVPASLGVLVIAFRGGPSHVSVEGLRNATMIVALRGGSAHFKNVGGDGFVQVLNGRVIATDSQFDRIRVRTVTENVVFERCSAKQIEASSVDGSVVYDNGSFVPGQARFESTNGNVLLGIGSGGAQLAAHSGSGRVLESRRARDVTTARRRCDGDRQRRRSARERHERQGQRLPLRRADDLASRVVGMARRHRARLAADPGMAPAQPGSPAVSPPSLAR